MEERNTIATAWLETGKGTRESLAGETGGSGELRQELGSRKKARERRKGSAGQKARALPLGERWSDGRVIETGNGEGVTGLPPELYGRILPWRWVRRRRAMALINVFQCCPQGPWPGLACSTQS